METRILTGSWLAFLLAVFLVHLIIFAWRTWRGRGLGDAVTSLTFLLLCLSFALRWQRPEWHVASFPVYTALRYLAWGTLTWRLLLWLHQHRPSRGSTAADPQPSEFLSHPGHGGQPSATATGPVSDAPQADASKADAP